MNFKKYKVAYLIGLVIIVAFGIRVYNFSDWLMFKADQSRDASIVKQAVDNGMGELPLFGPAIGEKVHIPRDPEGKVGKPRLGPFYYYQQYAIAKITGNLSPYVFAIGDLILSIAAICMFYIFARVYFSAQIALLTMILFSFSFYIIQYARFAWNPNQLLFWVLVFMLGLHKASFEKNKKIAGIWLSITVVSYAIMTQLHVVALFGLFPIAVIFWMIYKPKVHWKFWVVGFVISGLLYVPVVLGDIKNQGENFERFMTVLSKERSKKSFKKRVGKLMNRHGEISSVILTSFHDKEVKKIENYGVIFFVASMILLIFSVWYIKAANVLIKKGKSPGRVANVSSGIANILPRKAPFTVLLIIWIGVYMGIFFKLVEDLNRARYFLVIAPVICLFMGYWFVVIQKIFTVKIAKTIIGIIMVGLMTANISALAFWHNTLNNFEQDVKTGRAPKMAYHKGFITVNTMKESLDYIVAKASRDNMHVCYMSADYQYNKGLEYLSEVYYEGYKISRFGMNDLYNDCMFFVVARTKNGEAEIPKGIAAKFKVVDVSTVNAWNIWQIDYRSEFKKEIENNGISSWRDRKSRKEYKIKNEKDAACWNDLFN